MKKQDKPLNSLISLDEFKSQMGIDSREDKTAAFCLVTATLAIEQYCMRRFLRKKKVEIIEITKDLIIPLREYPVSQVMAVYGINNQQEIYIEPFFYRVMTGCGYNEEMLFSLSISNSLNRYRFSTVKIIYRYGYKTGNVPADLSAACMELAAWNMNRYRGRRIGMTGNIKGAGIQGEHFELSMPENVKALLEMYRRKTI